MPGSVDKLSVQISTLDEYSTAQGAALLIREKLLLSES